MPPVAMLFGSITAFGIVAGLLVQLVRSVTALAVTLAEIKGILGVHSARIEAQEREMNQFREATTLRLTVLESALDCPAARAMGGQR